MDISVWELNQAMETKGVCILLMNEDPTSNNIATEMLQRYHYEVMRIGDSSDVLNSIHKTKDRLELVLTNAHKLESDGEAIIQYIQNNCSLPIALMGPHKSKMIPNGQTCSFTAYLINGLSREEVTYLRDFALQSAKGKMVATNQDENNAQRSTMATDAINKKNSSTISETTCSKKRKGQEEKDESQDDGSPIQKKGRVHWSPEMHKKFLEAIEIIGYDRAVPKKIAEVMNIPGLTRENVASHLQKHRENIKREIAIGKLPINTTNEFKSSPFLPQNSTTRLNASRSPYLAQETYNMQSLQQSSLISHALNRRYLNTKNKFSFMTTTGWNNFTNLSDLQLRPKFVPEFQSSRNFRIYSDHTKNVLFSVNRGNSSNQIASYKFVGLKLTNEGNQIRFGENGTSQIQFTSYNQQNLVPEHNPSSLTAFISQDSSVLENILAQCHVPQEIENQVQVPITPLNGISQEQHVLQWFGTSGNENTKTIPDQFHNDDSKEQLRTVVHENDDTLSTFVPHQDFLSPWLDTSKNDIATFIEGVSGGKFSRPQEFDEFPVLLNGTEYASFESFGWDELDNSLFDNDS